MPKTLVNHYGKVFRMNTPIVFELHRTANQDSPCMSRNREDPTQELKLFLSLCFNPGMGTPKWQQLQLT